MGIQVVLARFLVFASCLLFLLNIKLFKLSNDFVISTLEKQFSNDNNNNHNTNTDNIINNNTVITASKHYLRERIPQNYSSTKPVTKNPFYETKQQSTSRKIIYPVAESAYWWKHYTSNLSRVFESPVKNNNNDNDNNNNNNLYPWCIPEETPTHDWRLGKDGTARGLIYIKTYKASSSTLEGVSLSIAHHVARRIMEQQKPKDLLDYNNNNHDRHSISTPPCCIHYNRHVFQDLGGLQYRGNPSLVWTMIRHPTSRDLSSYYFFEASRKGSGTSDEEMIPVLQSYKSFQTNYLLPSDKFDAWSGSNLLLSQHLPLEQQQQQQIVVVEWMQQQIINNYDFIGITERMDESLAVMVLLWHLEPSDVIVLSAKQSGGYDDAGGTGTCTKIIPQPSTALHSEKLQSYLEKEHPLHHADFLLYDVVNESLDLTIQNLGYDRVQRMVQEIQRLRNLAEIHCQEKAFFPCSSDGTVQLDLAKESCYVQDAGCGHQCVEKVLNKEQQQQQQ